WFLEDRLQPLRPLAEGARGTTSCLRRARPRAANPVGP
ncbi:MAG: hypothetical protein AVDCRST_MAG59-5334, partial [uncultured Thermomicrobiales bacterium]